MHPEYNEIAGVNICITFSAQIHMNVNFRSLNSFQAWLQEDVLDDLTMIDWNGQIIKWFYLPVEPENAMKLYNWIKNYCC